MKIIIYDAREKQWHVKFYREEYFFITKIATTFQEWTRKSWYKAKEYFITETKIVRYKCHKTFPKYFGSLTTKHSSLTHEKPHGKILKNILKREGFILEKENTKNIWKQLLYVKI